MTKIDALVLMNQAFTKMMLAPTPALKRLATKEFNAATAAYDAAPSTKEST